MRVGLLALVLCSGCWAQREEPAARAAAALVGGTVDDGGFPEVVALRLNLRLADGGIDFKHCSGTLITPAVVLTAAHCTTGLLLPGATLVAMEVQPGSPVDAGLWQPVASWRAHPSWTTSTTSSFDIGAVALAGPLPGVTPRPWSRRALVAADVGRPLDVVGFGVTASGSLDFGVRRAAQLPLRGLTSTLLQLGDLTSTGICNGDSGGPSILREEDGVGRVVGVHSRTVPGANCLDGVDTRVHVYADFLRRFLEDTTGASCVEDGLCASGCPTVDLDCACAADGQCSAECPSLLTDPDCPRDCVANGVCATDACPAPDPDCADELAPCTADTQCQYRTCTDDPERGERYCTRPCAATCPAGTACDGAVCLKALPESCLPSGGDAGVCQPAGRLAPVSGGCVSAPAPVLGLLALVLAALGRRR